MSIQWKLIKEETPPSKIEFVAYNPNRETRKLSAVFKFSSSFSEDKIKEELLNSNYTHWAVIQ